MENIWNLPEKNFYMFSLSSSKKFNKRLKNIFEADEFDTILYNNALEDTEKNYKLNIQETKDKILELKSYPIKAKFSVSAYCNIGCVFCKYFNRIPQKREKGELFPSESIIIEVLKILSRVKEAYLYREGEPLLNKDFFKYAKFARNFGATRIDTSTGGSLINDTLAKKLVSLPLTTIIFSIHALSQDIIAKISPGTSYEKIINSLLNIKKYKVELGQNLPNLQWVMVINRLNIDDLAPAVRLASEFGFQSFNVNYMGVTEGMSKELEQKLSFQKEDFDIVEDKLLEASVIAKKNNIPFFRPILNIKEDQSNKSGIKKNVSNICKFPWQSVEIEVSGDIIPCCGHRPPIGNLKSNSFEEMWNGEKYIALRKSLAENNLDQYCKNCRYGFKI